MTYLELVREVARLSGTTDPRSIATVQNATGRIAVLARLVNTGWKQIQTAYRAWRFLIADLPEATRIPVGVSVLTAATLNLPNWGEWILGGSRGTARLTVWPAEAAEDRNEELPLSVVEYEAFRAAYRVGANRSVTGRPRAVSVDQQDRLVVWPVPERDYRMDGTFRRSPQVFVADTDVPIVDDAYHDTLVYQALLLLHRRDEADRDVLITTQQSLDTELAALRRRYLPQRVEFGAEPLGERAAFGARTDFAEPPGVLGAR